MLQNTYRGSNITYSQNTKLVKLHKHHNTVKYLVGNTPQGLIAFVFNGCGEVARASDIHITQNSGLLSKLLPGDMTLDDRGFTIQESIGLYCAKVNLLEEKAVEQGCTM